MTDYFELGRTAQRARTALLIRCLRAECEVLALREALVEARSGRSKGGRMAEAEKERLRALRKSGLTTTQIAWRTGWAESTIRRLTRANDSG